MGQAFCITLWACFSWPPSLSVCPDYCDPLSSVWLFACPCLPLLLYIPVFFHFMSLLSLFCVSPKLTSADPTGLTTSPARGRLQCYTCSFAKPCDPVLTECQEDEVCGISVGTSGRALVQWPFWGGSSPLSPSPQPQRASFVPQIRGMRSSSGKAACLGPSALCWAAPHTGHSPMLSATSAVSRTCATRQPRSDSQAIPTPPSCSLVPSLPGLHISSSSL